MSLPACLSWLCSHLCAYYATGGVQCHPWSKVQSAAAVAAQGAVKTSLFGPHSSQMSDPDGPQQLIAAVQHKQGSPRQQQANETVGRDSLTAHVNKQLSMFDLHCRAVDGTCEGLQQQLVHTEKQLAEETAAQQAVQQDLADKALAADILRQQLAET